MEVTQQTAIRGLAAGVGRVGVGELLGHGGRGESDDQGDGEKELLHR